MIPNDRRYTASHEWVKLEDGLAVVGVTDHAQKELGDITYVEPAAAGKRLARGAECGTIESVKAASEIYAPVGGVVAAINEELEDAPQRVNQDPYGQGWILKLKEFAAAEYEALLDAAAAGDLVGALAELAQARAGMRALRFADELEHGLPAAAEQLRAVEGWRAGEQFVEQHAEAVDIAPRVHVRA